jgi:hypothetical protein
MRRRLTAFAVYMAWTNGHLPASDPRLLWSFPAHVPEWTFPTGVIGYASPVVAGDVVYIGTGLANGEGSMYGLRTNAMYHQGGDHATPVVSGRLVYVASGNDHVYALAAGNGHLVWDRTFANWFLQPGSGRRRHIRRQPGSPAVRDQRRHASAVVDFPGRWPGQPQPRRGRGSRVRGRRQRCPVRLRATA